MSVYRKDFRPSYGTLGIFGSIFPKVPWRGLTATTTKRPNCGTQTGQTSGINSAGNATMTDFSFMQPE